MNLYEKWQKEGTDFTDQGEYNAYWDAYFEKEKRIYEEILNTKTSKLEGKISDLATHYNITPLEMVGFLDGINTSLESEIDLNLINEESEISVNIVYEKLLFNMYKAKADWLYGIEVWKDIFDSETRAKIKKDYLKSGTVRKNKEVGRNEPCPCGSGKKYKKCCINKEQ